MKRPSLIAPSTVVLLACLACGEAARPVGPLSTPDAVRPSAAVVENTGREPFSGALLDQCTAEVVDLTGWGRTTSVQTVDAAGGTHTVFHTVLFVTGVGQTTGAQYVGSQQVTQVAQGLGSSVDILIASAQLISKGDLDNRLRSIRMRLVVNAQGEVVVDFADSEIACH